MRDFLSRLVQRTIASQLAVRPQVQSFYEPPSSDVLTRLPFAENSESSEEPTPASDAPPSIAHATPSVKPLRTMATAMEAQSRVPEAEQPELARNQPRARPLTASNSSVARSEAQLAERSAPDQSGPALQALRHREASVALSPAETVTAIETEWKAPESQQSEAARSKTFAWPTMVSSSSVVRNKTELAGHPDLLGEPKSESGNRSHGEAVVPSGADKTTRNISGLSPEADTTVKLSQQIRPAVVRAATAETSIERAAHGPTSQAAFPSGVYPREQPEVTASSVHITIGRVEVRAVNPPAKTSLPASQATPRLSLDAYLKQMRGGAAR
jgi:hypothetical protein